MLLPRPSPPPQLPPSIPPSLPPLSATAQAYFATASYDKDGGFLEQRPRPLHGELQRRRPRPPVVGTTGARSCNLVVGSCNRQRRELQPPVGGTPGLAGHHGHHRFFATTSVKNCYNRSCYNPRACPLHLRDPLPQLNLYITSSNQWLQLFYEPVASFPITSSNIFNRRFQLLFNSFASFLITGSSFPNRRLQLSESPVAAFKKPIASFPNTSSSIFNRRFSSLARCIFFDRR